MDICLRTGNLAAAKTRSILPQHSHFTCQLGNPRAQEIFVELNYKIMSIVLHIELIHNNNGFPQTSSPMVAGITAASLVLCLSKKDDSMPVPKLQVLTGSDASE